MLSSQPPTGFSTFVTKFWDSPRSLLGSYGRPVIVSSRIRQVNSPYYTKPKPVASSLDTLNTLEGTVVLDTITCKEKEGICAHAQHSTVLRK